MLAPVFLAACQRLQATDPALRYIVPLVNARRRAQFEAYLAATAPELPITLFDGQARDVMAASSAILLASGTATLEAMLVKRPMVVAYRVKPFTFWLAEKLVKPLVDRTQALVRDGVIADGELADAGVIFGTGFAPFTGGPLRHAQQGGA